MIGPKITLHRVDIEAVWRNRDAALGWLSTAEQESFNRLQVFKRRRDWLAGRYAAKWAVREQIGRRDLPCDRIEIFTAHGGPEHGRPRVVINEEAAVVDVSISHSESVAVAGAVALSGLRIGIDVEHIAGRDESFEALALTPQERRALKYVGATRAETVTRYWALKEALVKATGTGLRACLTDLDIFTALDGARPIFHPTSGQRLAVAGWGAETRQGVVYAWVTLRTRDD